MMRLVVDDEDVREDDQKNRYRIPVSNSPTDTNDDAAPSRKRRKPAAPQEPVKLAIESEPAPAVEQIDGPVEDAGVAEEEADTAEQTAADVDLTLLEALLFSTHHPLTAPRLAELMELASASSLRKAIKALNAQYEESKRSFR